MRTLTRYLTVIGVSIAILVSAIAPSFAGCNGRREPAKVFSAVIIRQLMSGRHDNSYRMRPSQKAWRNSDRRDYRHRSAQRRDYRRDSRGDTCGRYDGCRR